MTDHDDYLTTSELASVLGLPRSTVDRMRKPPPRYRRYFDRASRCHKLIEVPQAPPIRWLKVEGRVLYPTSAVEAFLGIGTPAEKESSRAAERAERYRALLRSREPQSYTFDDYAD